MIQQQWLLHVTRCKLRFDGEGMTHLIAKEVNLL